MPIKNLSSFFNNWWVCGLLATLAVTLPLLNAWLGYPIPVGFNAYYSTLGGVIPYSDANGYIIGANFFNDMGYLDSWNMRRPLNALFFAFRLKITNYNFWYSMLLQAALCATSLTIYLRTIQKDLGFLATLLSLAFLFYYIQNFAHSTLSETLGLTLGLLSFVLLWNGWLQKNRVIFNAGMASLAVALSARAGPNFMAPALFLLVYLEPFTSSRFKDVGWAIISFTIPFILLTKLSTLFGDPAGSGMAFSNFGSTVYGLVNGGKSWTYAYQDPHLQSLFAGKTEAEQAKIFYEASWRVFKNNPLNLIGGIIVNLQIFLSTFTYKLAFGTGNLKVIITSLLSIVWLILGLKVFTKRHAFKHEYLFLTIIFLGILASVSITWIDGGIRPFAAAIPFMGALLGLSFASLPTLIKRKVPETILSICIVAFIVLGSVLSPFILPKMKVPDISALKADKIPGQEIFLIYNLNKQAHLIIDSPPGFHFRTISPDKLKPFLSIYEEIGKELREILEKNSLNKFAIICIYDYISHSTKYIVSDLNLLSQDGWLLLYGTATNKETGVYRVDKFTGVF